MTGLVPYDLVLLQATTIASFARMTVEDSRKILPADVYPSWVVFSRRQKASLPILFSVSWYRLAPTFVGSHELLLKSNAHHCVIYVPQPFLILKSGTCGSKIMCFGIMNFLVQSICCWRIQVFSASTLNS
jgi:hypothetical protein